MTFMTIGPKLFSRSKGQFVMVSSFLLCDASGKELGKVRRKAWSFLPSFRCETEAGEFSVSRSSAFCPSYKISPLGYVAKGDFPRLELFDLGWKRRSFG